MRRFLALAASFAMLLSASGRPVSAEPVPASVSGILSAPSNGQSGACAVLTPSNGSTTPAPPAVAAPAGSRLFAVPVLEPGKQAWVTVYDQASRPLPAVSVAVNGTAVCTDNMGQCSFSVPTVPRLTLSLIDGQGKPFASVEYATTAGGLLVSEKNMQVAADRLEDTVVSNEMAPAIAYAPAVVESDQPFVIIGKNLSGLADGDHLLLDGYDADVFSGSSVCLLATPPRRLEAGPLREMYVTARGETSNTVEVDVCRVELSVGQAAADRAELATVRVIGTNVPALVGLQNFSPDKISLVYQGKTLGTRSAFVTPGGDNNCVSFAVKHFQTGSFDVDTHVVADAPWSADDRAVFGDSNLRQLVCELNKAEIMRLKRRLIAIETRSTDEKAKRTSELAAGSLHANDLDRYNSELRTLCNRQHRINTMITCRRSVFQALGGTDSQYRQALDEASGGAVISLDKTLAPIASAALLASTSKAVEPKVAAQSGNPTQAEEKQLQASMAELTSLWKKMPAKIGHNTRLAPPPEPYIPKPSQLELTAASSDYYQLIKSNNAPPPPAVLKELISAQRQAHCPAKTSQKSGKHKRKRPASNRHKRR